MVRIGYYSDFYRRLSERHQRIAEQLGLFDRVLLWLQSKQNWLVVSHR
jgi:hypothetical protein